MIYFNCLKAEQNIRPEKMFSIKVNRLFVIHGVTIYFKCKQFHGRTFRLAKLAQKLIVFVVYIIDVAIIFYGYAAH